MLLLTTDTVAKLQGMGPWVHISQPKKAALEPWSRADGDR